MILPVLLYVGLCISKVCSIIFMIMNLGFLIGSFGKKWCHHPVSSQRYNNLVKYSQVQWTRSIHIAHSDKVWSVLENPDSHDSSTI